MVIKKIKSKKDIFYFAHRGANKLYPENSLESFQKAIELGCDGIEMDIQITKDDKLIVFHDCDIHVDGNQYFISELRYMEIIKIFESIKQPPPILFNNVIPIINQYPDIVFNIEIKSNKYNNLKCIKLLNQTIPDQTKYNQCIFSSFNFLFLLQLKLYLGKKIFIGMILGSNRMKNNPNGFLNKILIQLIRPDFLHPNADYLNLQLVDWAHQKNILVNSYTVNSKSNLDEISKFSIDGVFTDNHQLYFK